MIQSKHRFHGRSSLRFVHQKGRVVRTESLTLRFVPNARQGTYRTAVVVSRKVSKSAVLRNRIRRRIFEIVRRESGRFTAPYDLVFIAQDAELAGLEHDELRQRVVALLTQANVRGGAQTPSTHGIVEGKEN